MRIAIILKVPEDMVLTDLSPEVQQAVMSLIPSWPSTIMSGTRVVDGYKLIYAVISLVDSDPLSKIIEMIIAFKLDWQVMAMQDFSYSEEAYLPVLTETLDYIIPHQDEDGNDIPISVDNLSKYQGQSDWSMED